LLATASLVFITAIWGSTFVIVKHAVARMEVMDFLAWRFALATLAMLAVRPAALRRLPRAGWRAGLLLGGALAAGYVTQTFGLRTTPASVSGFITGLFVVLTPLAAAVLLRKRVTGRAWLAVAVATAGLALLALRGFAVGGGEALTFLCAVAFALHIVGLGEWSHRFDSVALASVQLATVTVICAAAASGSGLRPPPDAGVWGALLLTGLAATALAFFVQTWAQARLDATRAAVVLTMEPVFAGVFGVTLGGDRIGLRTGLGAAAVIAAMLLVETGPRAGAEARVGRLEA
jgi:drug/metabolite transporter (DMT)-like permease